MENFVQIGEHRFILPELPEPKDILFSDLPKEEQYWRRQTDFPDFFWKYTGNTLVNQPVTRLTEDRQSYECLSIKDTNTLVQLRDREFIRRQQGVWFMNNGEPTYLTGDHYFALQWNRMGGTENHVEPNSRYGAYLQFQRNFFYFYKIAEKTPHGLGGYFIKPKKTGITQCAAAIALNRATMMRNIIIKIMSTDHLSCKNVNFKYISYALQYLPPIMTPSIQTLNLGRVFFGPEEVARTQKSRATQAQTELFSEILTIPTTYNGFDQSLNFLAWCDEFPKIDKPESTHTPTIASVKLGFKRKGTVLYTAYVPEGETSADGKVSNAEAIKQAEKIYWDSKLNTIAHEREDSPDTEDFITSPMTKSKLICYCLPVTEGNFGKVDKYGLPKKREILAVLQSEYEARKHDPNQLIAYKKQNPTSEEEAWMRGGENRSAFNLVRLGNRLAKVNLAMSAGTISFKRGNLEWVQGCEPKYLEYSRSYDFTNAKVWFKEDKPEDIRDGAQPGDFTIYRPELLPQEFNSWVIDRDNKMPRPKKDPDYFLSLDPTNYGMKSMVTAGSKNALMGFVLPNTKLDSYFGKKVSNRHFLEYICRKDKPEDTVWDVVKSTLYFGSYMLCEGNMPGIMTRCIEMGLGNFFFVGTKDGGFEPYAEHRKQKYYTTSVSGSKNIIDEYVSDTKNYIAEPDGKGVDMLETIDSQAVLNDLMEFRQEETTKFDAGVAFMTGRMGISAYLGWKHKMERADRKETDRIIAAAVRGASY